MIGEVPFPNEIGVEEEPCERLRHAFVVVGIDDTDDISKETSTGSIASSIAEAAGAMGGNLRLGITRHQLLLSDEVPYTSHNSSMVFEAFLPYDHVSLFCRTAESIIEDQRAPSSNPGLCLAVLDPDHDRPEFSRELRALVEFGEKAKSVFCPTTEAYGLAEGISWLTLKSCGGNESGVVGALAGVGLRMGGNDGRFRGKKSLSDLRQTGAMATIGSVVRGLEAAVKGPIAAIDTSGSLLDHKTPFSCSDEVKFVLHNAAMTIVCAVEGGIAYPFSKEALGEIDNGLGSWKGICDAFEWDNDCEECAGNEKGCLNCLYRRWVAHGFRCIKEDNENVLIAQMEG